MFNSKSICKYYACNKLKEKTLKQNVLPEFNLKTYKAVQTIAGKKSEFNNWTEALNYMYNDIIKIEFDIVILGCGAYGFPLASMLKKNGKISLHLGGVTQMLFGIKGKRWDDDPETSKLYNDFWVRPNEDETPANNKDVEEGCYW